MRTQKDDLEKEIKTLQVMLQHAKMMGDARHAAEFEDKILTLRSSINNMM
tara:strand:+ start:3099 stop:3248 length:150 start_codon:yes stop_codon:yes gene_type:complete